MPDGTGMHAALEIAACILLWTGGLLAVLASRRALAAAPPGPAPRMCPARVLIVPVIGLALIGAIVVAGRSPSLGGGDERGDPAPADHGGHGAR